MYAFDLQKTVAVTLDFQFIRDYSAIFSSLGYSIVRAVVAQPV